MSAPGPNTPPVSGDEKGFRLEIEVFDPAKTEDIEWAWDGFLPYEMLAILSGESGNGKSLIAIDILARKTSGRSMPLEPERADLPPEKVLYLAREDLPIRALWFP